jgi:hypothetical protein
MLAENILPTQKGRCFFHNPFNLFQYYDNINSSQPTIYTHKEKIMAEYEIRIGSGCIATATVQFAAVRSILTEVRVDQHSGKECTCISNDAPVAEKVKAYGEYMRTDLRRKCPGLEYRKGNRIGVLC